MDPFTHGLASDSITRAVFPRASRATVIAAILAGCAADLDRLSEYAGPSAFLDWHRTATHSVLGTLIIVAVFVIAASIIGKREADGDSVRTVLLALLAASSRWRAAAATACAGHGRDWGEIEEPSRTARRNHRSRSDCDLRGRARYF